MTSWRADSWMGKAQLISQDCTAEWTSDGPKFIDLSVWSQGVEWSVSICSYFSPLTWILKCPSWELSWVDQLNYFKCLFIGGNWLVWDDFNKKRQNLAALFVYPVWISKEQEATQAVFTGFTSQLFTLHRCKLGTSLNLKRWVQCQAFPAAQLCGTFCCSAEMLMLLLSRKSSCDTSALLLHCPSNFCRCCWDEVLWLKAVRSKGVLRRWLKLQSMAWIVLCAEKRCLRDFFLFLWSLVLSPVFCTF